MLIGLFDGGLVDVVGYFADFMREHIDLKHVGGHAEEHVFEEAGEDSIVLEEEV